MSLRTVARQTLADSTLVGFLSAFFALVVTLIWTACGGITFDPTGLTDLAVSSDLGTPGRCQPQPGLKLCFSFEEISGPTLDSSGYGNHGSAAMQKVKGKFGNAVGFNSTSISVPSQPSLEITPAGATVAFWFRIDAPQFGGVYLLRRLEDANEISIAVTDVFLIATWSNASGNAVINGAVNSGGNWVYVAFTNSGDEVRMYVNGRILRKTVNPIFPNFSNAPLVFGQNKTTQFNGLIDEFSWWDRVLTEKEICSLGGGTWLGSEQCTLP